MTEHPAHTYISTACVHDLCTSCRNTCKYCDTSCTHDCHRRGGRLPAPWVDQARGVALELLTLIRTGTALPDELMERVSRDPDLFWLRGEIKPDGVWRSPGAPR